MKQQLSMLGRLTLLGFLGLGLAQPSLAAHVSVTQPAKPGAKVGSWHGGSGSATSGPNSSHVRVTQPSPPGARPGRWIAR